MKNFEYYTYESRPYAYALISVFSLAMNHHDSKLLNAAALILGLCSYLVFKARYEYRRRPKSRRY